MVHIIACRCVGTVYPIKCPSIFIYWSVSTTSISWFVLWCWLWIIIDFIPIYQKIIYPRLNRHLPLTVLLFNISEHMWIRSLCVNYKPPLNTVQLLVFEFLMFYENTALLPPVDSSDLSPGNYEPTEGITVVIVGISISTQPGWVEVANEDWIGGTNTLSPFLRSVRGVRHSNFCRVEKLALLYLKECSVSEIKPSRFCRLVSPPGLFYTLTWTGCDCLCWSLLLTAIGS